ncbi:ras-like protein family member 10B isoform X2 [Pomacea canaliculata]|uniref:ras-like protein family member 10B isoform X2 n=1 Tax=Pomacea canaliculata TaxID=400727 RepID=UPI000D72DB44|nr:ras-like protein family member 10B isoform X2 [Pomacea canaliculata]
MKRNVVCSVETASPTPSPSHASGAAGPSYSAHHGDDSNDIEQIVTVTTTAASGHARYQPLGHHHQIHDDDILPFPCDPPAAPADVESAEPRGAGGQAAARPDPHHRDKGKSHRRRLVGGVPSCHMTIDSDYQNVRLAVLGAPGVGKSAIVKQFVMQQFPEEYVPTEQRQVFCPAVIINDHLYEVRIIDCPYIPYFPVSSLYEWTDFRGYGLRNATAYILVYDITSEDSFQYIKNIREQILESRDMHDVPMFVVGNKHDLAEERGMPRREVANLVKKQWKCGYIECSAKFNWHIMLLFKELMKSVDYIDYGHKPTSVRVQDALRRNRCFIL